MATLLLRLVGPMQSWGTTSRFEIRDSQLEPSKSGVIGITAAALGRDRSEDITDLANLRMGVRVDREGILKRDYHTAREVVQYDGKLSSNRNLRNIVSERFYLADAAFLVGLSGDKGLLEKVHAALKNPHWVLALGRKSFTPSQPIYLADGIVEEELETALESYEPIHDAAYKATRLRYAIEDLEGSQVRQDQPVNSFAKRDFAQRRIRIESKENPFYKTAKEAA